ncbi:MAG: ABC transporter ATP-binding protein, partial [Candidatus Atribacteria bacterium]|nr:ABC transporter ATP-binding protein [Candidatus Atribacteria bacterium]
MARIELKNIAYSYNGKINAVENINLTFSKEGRYSLLGPSGCGKTTLLKIIVGLLHPQGKVFFDGQDMTDTSVEDRDIAMLFQFPVVYPMSVFENLMFPLQRKKISRKEKEKKVLK